MDKQDQVGAFHKEISAVIQRYAKEFDLPALAALGVLEDCKFRILLKLYDVPEFRDDAK